jgi:hypothetical protein
MSTSEKSQWSVVGLAHKFGLAWESLGGTLADINHLAENVDFLRLVIGVLRGTHEIKPKVFPLWRSVTLGIHQSPEAYLASIEARGRKPNKWAREIAAKVTCSKQQVELPLVDVSGADIGFWTPYTYEEFLHRAETFGLYRCPGETGLALADQFDDQPSGDYRRIGMDGIADSGGDLGVFGIGRDEGEPWLGSNDGHPQYRWNRVVRWSLTSRKP